MRLWLTIMFKTFIIEFSNQLTNVMTIIEFFNWYDENHFFRQFTSTTLLNILKIINRYKNDSKNDDFKKKVDDIFKIFQIMLSQLQIKHEKHNKWFEKSFIKLSNLIERKYFVHLTKIEKTNVDNLMNVFVQKTMNDFEFQQIIWNKNQNNKICMRKYLLKSSNLKTKTIFDKNRMCRNCNNLSSLTIQFKKKNTISMNYTKNTTTLSKQNDKTIDKKLLIERSIFRFDQKLFQIWIHRQNFIATFDKKNVDFFEFVRIFDDRKTSKLFFQHMLKRSKIYVRLFKFLWQKFSTLNYVFANLECS